MLRFKFSYEASHKLLKRFLEQTAASPEKFLAAALAQRLSDV